MNKHFIFGLGLGYLFTRGGRRRNSGDELSYAMSEPTLPDMPSFRPTKKKIKQIERAADKSESEGERLSRDLKQVVDTKIKYDNTCQVCKTTMCGNRGPYSEVAHIMPLSHYRAGPTIEEINSPDNLLCMCSNCHKSFDNGAFYIVGKDYDWYARKTDKADCQWAERVDGKKLEVKRPINELYALYHEAMVTDDFAGINSAKKDASQRWQQVIEDE